jgi:acetylornithine deacetylase/succinyl-diaminopimelate desuccinylase-like protein
LLVDLLSDVGIEGEIIEVEGVPFVSGKIESDRTAPTLLIYGHYDVVPAEPLEDWASPPFEPEIREKRIYARGAGDNKGQLFAHLKAVEAYRAVKGQLPINLTFIFDGEEELGSPHFPALLERRPDIFEADGYFSTDGSTLDFWQPIVFLEIRGLLYLELKARGAKLDWHSGSYGNLIPNPALRIAQALASMRDPGGRILIEGFYDAVPPIGERERELVSRIPFDPERKLAELGVESFWGDPELSYYEKMFFRPSLSVCGIFGGYTGDGPKHVIPREARAKIDITLPYEEPEDVLKLVREHLAKHGFDDIQIEVLISNPPAITPFDSPFAELVQSAISEVWGQDPIIYPSIGGGGAHYLMSNVLGIPSLWVPYAQPDLHEHSPDENLHLDWFANGVKVTATLIDKFAGYPKQ